jgi:protocatechuate 3,4-dioxygenase beta subunit
MRQRRGQPNWMLMQALQDARRFRLNAISDAEGRYSIEAPASSFRLGATFGLDQVVMPDAVAVPAGGSVQVDVVLAEGGTIEGTVVDEQGRPVGGAWVQAWSRQRQQGGFGWGGRNLSARSQSDGTFVLRGVTSDNAWTVQARASGYQSNQTPEATAGSKGVEIRLVAMGWIVGTVTEDGRPYRGPFTVTATPAPDESGSNPNEMRWMGNNQQAFNTDDGRFLLRGMVAGTFLVSATTPDGAITVVSERVVVTNGQPSRDTTLALGRGAVVSGSVSNADTGRPLTSVHVWVSPRPGRDAPATNGGAQTDARGRFVVRGLAPGAYVIHVNPPSGIAWQEDVELQEGETKDVSLVERTPGKIHAFVLDPEGRPVPNAMLQVKSSTGNVIWPSWQALQNEGLLEQHGGNWDRMIRTDANGETLRHHVPPGRYEVTAQLEGWTLEGEAPWVDVHSGRTTQITVVLKSAGEAAPSPGSRGVPGTPAPPPAAPRIR